jgi:hypothetical protein
VGRRSRLAALRHGAGHPHRSGEAARCEAAGRRSRLAALRLGAGNPHRSGEAARCGAAGRRSRLAALRLGAGNPHRSGEAARRCAVWRSGESARLPFFSALCWPCEVLKKTHRASRPDEHANVPAASQQGTDQACASCRRCAKCPAGSLQDRWMRDRRAIARHWRSWERPRRLRWSVAGVHRAWINVPWPPLFGPLPLRRVFAAEGEGVREQAGGPLPRCTQWGEGADRPRRQQPPDYSSGMGVIAHSFRRRRHLRARANHSCDNLLHVFMRQIVAAVMFGPATLCEPAGSTLQQAAIVSGPVFRSASNCIAAWPAARIATWRRPFS